MKYDYQASLEAVEVDDQVLLVDNSYLSHIEGRVLTLLEGVLPNMEKRKASAIKSLVNAAIWGNVHNGWATLFEQSEWENLFSN